MLYLEWDLINLVQYLVQQNLFYLILSAYLEDFKPCGYFLRIKKTKGNSGKFKVTQGIFWSLREDFLT